MKTRRILFQFVLVGSLVMFLGARYARPDCGCLDDGDGTCYSDDDCCNSDCDQETGICGGGDCLDDGNGTCYSDDDCCNEDCDEETGICGGGCEEGGFCSSDEDCCSGLICNTTWYECVTCIDIGDGDCESDSDCCYGTYCDLGSSTCQTIP